MNLESTNVSYLCFFMMLYKLFGGHAMQVTQLGLHHDRQLTHGLFDDAFRNAIDWPADVCLSQHKAQPTQESSKASQSLSRTVFSGTYLSAHISNLPPAFPCMSIFFPCTRLETPSFPCRCSLWRPPGCGWWPRQTQCWSCHFSQGTPREGWTAEDVARHNNQTL